MQPTLLDIEAIARSFDDLATAKGWGAYHSPKNLAAALAVESAELLEIFQWLTEAQSLQLKDDSGARQRVAGEMADVLMYLVALAARMDISLPEAVAHKIAVNRQRFLTDHS